MFKPEISILCPSIRPNNLKRVYDSILNSTKRRFELIIVSPYVLPIELQGISNIKSVVDFGSPTRASCIASLLIEGKYVFPTMADDAIFIDGAIDKNLDLLISMGDDIKNAVVCKYSESQGFSAKERYQPDDYYKMVNSYAVNKEICPKGWLIFNAVFLHSKYFEEIGGYDSSFETACIGHADLAMRSQLDGVTTRLSEFPIIQCDHIPSGGDHTPIEINQVHYSSPKFAQKYNQYLNQIPIKIPIDNWKKADAVWKFRFKQSE